MEDDFDCKGSDILLRLFTSLTSRYPRWLVPDPGSAGAPARYFREQVSFLVDDLLTTREEDIEENHLSFESLLASPAFCALQLHQLVELLDRLPPDSGDDKDGALLVGSARVDKLFDVSKPLGDTGFYRSAHAKLTMRELEGVDGMGAEPPCTLGLHLYQHFKKVDGAQKLNNIHLETDGSPIGCHRLARFSDVRMRVSLVGDVDNTPIEEEVSKKLMDFRDDALFWSANNTGDSTTGSLLDDLFSDKRGAGNEKSADDKKGTAPSDGSTDGAGASTPSDLDEGRVAASRLQLHIEMRRTRECRRREMLEAWARSRDSECKSLSGLIIHFDELLDAYEAQPRKGDDHGAGGSARGVSAARGAPPPEAFAALRNSIIDDSLAPHACKPAALVSVLAGDCKRISPSLLKRILSSRPPPCAAADEKDDAIDDAPSSAAPRVAAIPTVATATAGTDTSSPTAPTDLPSRPASAASESSPEASGATAQTMTNGDKAPEKASTAGEAGVGDDAADGACGDACPRSAAAREESALLDALRPWCAVHSLDDLLVVLPALRLELIPLEDLRKHVLEPAGCLHAVCSDAPGAKLIRARLADALLPGSRALRVASLCDDTPHELTCCLSHDLMTDPVVAQDGKSCKPPMHTKSPRAALPLANTLPSPPLA